VVLAATNQVYILLHELNNLALQLEFRTVCLYLQLEVDMTGGPSIHDYEMEKQQM
jgi:hypothetical protein